MVRAVRLAATLEFTIEPATLAGIEANADLVRYLSGERIATELSKLLAAERPSVGLHVLAATGLLDRIAPELARQRGVPQNKAPGEDLWDHTVRTVDAARVERPVVRLAALLHDIGKPATFSDGHFLGHDVVGAELAGELLDALRSPRARVRRQLRARKAEHAPDARRRHPRQRQRQRRELPRARSASRRRPPARPHPRARGAGP